MKYQIGVALPTRGLVFTETMRTLIRNLERHTNADIYWEIFSSDNLPIPQGHTDCVKRALQADSTHVWIVEEDVVFPDGILQEMLDLNAPVVASDYPQPFGQSVIARKEGMIIMASTGCLLVKREVFEKLPTPWFGTTRDMQMEVKGTKPMVKITERDPFLFGGQEIWFSSLLWEAGIPIVETELKCAQVKVDTVNFNSNNKGCHELSLIKDIKEPITPDYDL